MFFCQKEAYQIFWEIVSP